MNIMFDKGKGMHVSVCKWRKREGEIACRYMDRRTDGRLDRCTRVAIRGARTRGSPDGRRGAGSLVLSGRQTSHELEEVLSRRGVLAKGPVQALSYSSLLSLL